MTPALLHYSDPYRKASRQQLPVSVERRIVCVRIQFHKTFGALATPVNQATRGPASAFARKKKRKERKVRKGAVPETA
jgi:hypothetical protein